MTFMTRVFQPNIVAPARPMKALIVLKFVEIGLKAGSNVRVSILKCQTRHDSRGTRMSNMAASRRSLDYCRAMGSLSVESFRMPDAVNPETNSEPDSSPESWLRFSCDDLYAAGVRLGRIESSMASPRTTFEELLKRAQELDERIACRRNFTIKTVVRRLVNRQSRNAESCPRKRYGNKSAE
jgi:hypothetical protein